MSRIGNDSREYQKMWRFKTVFFFVTIGGAFIIWGLYFALQPPFYPSEAESKGATPAQVYILYL